MTCDICSVFVHPSIYPFKKLQTISWVAEYILIQLRYSFELMNFRKFYFFFHLLPGIIMAQYSTNGLDMDGDIETWYDGQIGLENTTLILGTYQDVQFGTLKNHPFYSGYSWQTGDVTYRGQKFTGVYMMYDTFQDLLLIKHPNLAYASQPICLFQDQVSEFDLKGHHFENLGNQADPFPQGFYDILYDGKVIDLLVKRIKKSETKSNHTSTQSFVENDIYLVRYEGIFYKYKGRGILKKLFPEFKKEISSHIRENSLFLRPGLNDNHSLFLFEFVDQKAEGL